MLQFFRFLSSVFAQERQERGLFKLTTDVINQGYITNSPRTFSSLKILGLVPLFTRARSTSILRQSCRTAEEGIFQFSLVVRSSACTTMPYIFSVPNLRTCHAIWFSHYEGYVQNYYSSKTSVIRNVYSMNDLKINPLKT
jgi:hypothetical protein